jgi:hypothetical protein
VCGSTSRFLRPVGLFLLYGIIFKDIICLHIFASPTIEERCNRIGEMAVTIWNYAAPWPIIFDFDDSAGTAIHVRMRLRSTSTNSRLP